MPNHLNAVNNLISNTALFVSSLYANPLIPRSNVQVVMESLQTFLGDSLECALRSRLEPLLNQLGSNKNVLTDLNETLSMVKNIVKDFQSEHMRLQYFTNLGTYIAPKQVVVGQQMEQKRTTTGLIYLPTDCTMQVIPLHKVLQKIFSVSGVLQDTLAYRDSLNLSSTSGAIHNFTEGSVWSEISQQQHTESNELCLPLILYYDDFEIGNPLGSHAGIHKLGGVYVSCPCLPPHYVSQLNQIFILALFHTSDRVMFGNKIIFHKVIEELNFLSKSGIIVNTAIFSGIIKFRIGAITGDNLGLN